MISEWLSSIRLRLRTLAKSRQLDRDLQDEMAFHLAMREHKLQERGAGAEEARYAAHRAFGNVVRIREKTRTLWTFRWLEELAQDLRYAGRSLRHSTALATVVVLSLALGIGANTAIFSLMDAVMLRLLPVQHPEQLVRVERQFAKAGAPMTGSFTNALWEALRDQQNVFAGAFAWGSTFFDLAQGGEVRNANGIFVSGDYFSTLGVQPAAGRLLNATDDRRGCASIAVLSYGFWESHFGTASNVLGQTITLNRHPFQIIGVSAPGFYGVDVGTKFDIAVPVCSAAIFDGQRSRLDRRSWWWLSIIGRVKPGLTPGQVKSGLAAVSPAVMRAALPQDWPSKEQEQFLHIQLATVPAATGTSFLRSSFAEPLNILMAIVALVLLIACANIASLMLARATARNKELAIRKALGASRGRLIRQLLTESLLLSVLGAMLGLLFARWGSALLVRDLSSGRQVVALDLTLDSRVLGFTAAIAIFTGILVGLLPALRSTGVSLTEAMKGSHVVNEEGRARFRAGKWIVASQIALCLVLLIGGGLLLRSFVKLTTLDLGFDRSNVLLVRTNFKTVQIPAAQQEATYDEIGRRLRALPGVLSESRSIMSPISSFVWNSILHADSNMAPTGDDAVAYFNFITPHYFTTMHSPLLRGRNFTEGDTKDSPPVAVVNETLARKFYPGMDALGRHFRVDPEPGQPKPLIEIVGIVKDAKYGSPREDTYPTAFFPITQMPAEPGMERTYELRTATPPMSLGPAVQNAVADISKEIPLEFETLATQVDESLVQERLLAKLSGFFGGLALLLAMIGLYGVLSYLVTQRQTEFGIRMALGAQPHSILRLVLRDLVTILGIGVAAGIGIALATVTLLQKMLFGLAPRDAETIVIAVCLLSAMAIIAGAIPARRAARVDPMVAIRYE